MNTPQVKTSVELINESANEMLKYAYGLASIYKFKVFPVCGFLHGIPTCSNPNCSAMGKHPIHKGWKELATTDPDKILSLWTNNPESNVGIMTGLESNLFVLDIDPRHGGDESYEKLGLLPSDLENVLIVKTGGGGRHISFCLPEKQYWGSRTNIAPGLDIRCQGGLIVAPPSIHKSGARYEVISWPNNPQQDLTPPPQKLLKLLGENPSWPTARMLPQQIKDGERNNALFTIANEMAFSNMSQEAILSALRIENQRRCDPPVSEERLEVIVKSTLNYDPGFDIDGKPIKVIPLPELPEVMPFNPEMLPDSIHAYVMDTAERMQVPPDFIGPTAMVLAGGLLGLQVRICPKANDDWMVAPNLWGCIVAPPGTRKTSALDAVVKPVWDLENAGERAYKKAMPFYDAKMEIFEERKKQLRSNAGESLDKNQIPEHSTNPCTLEEPEPPVQKRYLTNDTTVEALTIALKDNPNGLIVISDEIARFIHGIEKPNQSGARAFYNTAWSTKSGFRSDRVGRGSSIASSISVTIFGAIQPEPLDALVSKWAHNPEFADGFIQRFQVMVYPDIPEMTEIVDKKPDLEARKKAHKLFKQLADVGSMGMSIPEDDEGTAYLHFNKEAQGAYNSWFLENSRRANKPGEHSVMVAHVHKYPKLVASMSLIIHMIDDRGPEIGLVSIQKAVRWVEYLESHARRIYNPGSSGELQGARDLIRQIFDEDKYGEEFSLREITRAGGPNLKPVAKARKAIKVLVEHRFVFDITPENGKSRSKRYRVNPHALRRAA